MLYPGPASQPLCRILSLYISSSPHFLASVLVWQLQQDDNIDDEEAIREYAAYKLKFKTEQLTKFFADHKDEEW